MVEIADELMEGSPIAGAGERLVTSAEVFQEILHRYAAIRRRDGIGPAFEALLGIADDVLPMELEDVRAARAHLESDPSLLHAATMQRNGVVRIMTFDAGFDAIKGIERIHR